MMLSNRGLDSDAREAGYVKPDVKLLIELYSPSTLSRLKSN